VASARRTAPALSRIPKSRIMSVIAVLLLATAGLLGMETMVSGVAGTCWIRTAAGARRPPSAPDWLSARSAAYSASPAASSSFAS
jgi:hypothetical protein